MYVSDYLQNTHFLISLLGFKNTGYSLLFEDPDSTCVISTVTGLQTAPCVNLCFKKDLRKKASIIPPMKKPSDILAGLFSMFASKKQ